MIELGPIQILPDEHLVRLSDRTLILSTPELQTLVELGRRAERLVSGGHEAPGAFTARSERTEDEAEGTAGGTERTADGTLSEPQGRERFRRALAELEDGTLDALTMVVQQLDRALEAISYQDVELAGMVVADDDRIDRRYVEVHRGVLSLLAHQATPTGDVRTATALLHTVRCVERMGAQCANIAKLVPLSGHAPPKDKDILEAIERMGQLARSQTVAVRDAYGTRNLSLARDLVRQDSEINRLNRAIFRRAVEVGDNLELREWAMFMILVARCLERIGDNTVDIAGQVVFVITGMFWEPSDRGTAAEPQGGEGDR